MRTLHLSLIVAGLLIINLSLVSAESDSAESDISVEVEEDKSRMKEKTQEIEEKNDVEDNLSPYGMILVLLYPLLRGLFVLNPKEKLSVAQNER